MGKIATIFEIMWKCEYRYSVMDMSAFEDEKEILLDDGEKFTVISIE